jgi:FMN phosphatase YigB (HAD superfamily)
MDNKYQLLDMDVWMFSGTLGSGKNYVAENMFAKMLRPKRTIMLAFANHFKIDAIVKDNLDRNKVFGKKDEYTRKTLQIRGTEEGRDKYGENIWVDLLYEWLVYYKSLGYERAIIFDCRFPNEVAFGQAIGAKVIRVESGSRSLEQAKKEAESNGVPVETITSHLSETALNGYDGYYGVIDNDFGDNPVLQVRKLIQKHEAESKLDTVIFVDVDDTLCHSSRYYKDIENKVRNLLFDVAVFENIYSLDLFEAFDEISKGLRLKHHTQRFSMTEFPEVLVETLKETIETASIDSSKYSELLEEAYELGMSVYDAEYEAFEGAVEAVHALSEIGKVVFMTHGDRLIQAGKLAKLGLSQYEAYVSVNKNTSSYEMAMDMYPAKRHIMIGDNILRDIKASIDAGVTYSIWVDSKPMYSLGKCVEAYATVSHIKESVDIIKALVQ